jgi:glycosyltransferase involved in cell wall biosynthesis
VEAASGDQEGLGLVVVEAAGCGCPVVLSDLPATRDVLDGRGVRLVPPGDAAALARAIADDLSDPAAATTRAARARDALQARFDWQCVAQRYRAILASAYAGAPPPRDARTVPSE